MNRILSSLVLLEILGLVTLCGTVIFLNSAYPVKYEPIPLPVLPEDTPPQLMTLDNASLTPLTNGLLIFNGSSPLEVSIRCNYVYAWGHSWYGGNASIQKTGNSTQIEATPFSTSKTWGMTIVGSLGDTAVPEMSALLPVTTDEMHHWINVTAKMDVCYPSSAGSVYVDSTKTVFGNASLFVVSPEDIHLRNDFLNETAQVQLANERNMNKSEVGWVSLGVPAGMVWAFLCAPLIWILYRAYTRRKTRAMRGFKRRF